MSHWAAKYVGTPYAEGARGPEFFDCWGIIQLIYRQEKGIVLAEHPGLSAPQVESIHKAIVEEVSHAEIWRETASPTEGCVAAMGSSVAYHHVGVWLSCDGGKVLHSRQGQNAVVESLRSLRLRGMRVFKFYQHTQWPG